MVASNTEYFMSDMDDKTHCFYISFDLGDDGEIYQKIDDWSEDIFDDIANFALGKSKALELAQDSPRKAHREGRRLLYNIDEVKSANKYYLSKQYSKEDDKYLNRGEFGELILYHLLDRKLKKPQLISKLYFKDSFNAVVHGFDAVHYDTQNNDLWLGESKFYKDKNSALRELAKDLHSHFNVNFFNQEFTIISNRFSDLNIENEAIKQLIDPNTKFLSKMIKINACFFALFDSNILESFEFEEGSDRVSENFEEKLKETMKKTRNYFEKQISNFQNKERLKIHLLLFPVTSKNELVRKLHHKLKRESEA
ncbi:TPA: DUF1837 domain-containing protein [Streptococcus equi subsp. zooepidemicus]|nr:DUF1837 domain-containing protein [Streptococcus equi subsp. zooepidemicus]HEL0453157.1 DUF1837 domain-containing protein [Streptococcus equi subsp. zooepidemicus]HEL1334353.1 DUF1837 domain-containing protein [Streptococcus equi subsp. zooepidemicus]